MKTLSAICAEKRRDNSNVWVKLPQIVKSKITSKLIIFSLIRTNCFERTVESMLSHFKSLKKTFREAFFGPVVGSLLFVASTIVVITLPR